MKINAAPQKPYAILHIGLPKAGSTSLQQSFESAAAVLNADRYRYYPSMKMVKFLHFTNKTDQESPDFRHFKRFLDDAARNKHSIILSQENFVDERLPGSNLTLFQQLLRPWTVKIVVVYRRLFDLCLKSHFELHRFKAQNPLLCRWPTADPHDELQAFLQQSCQEHPISPLLALWRPTFPDISIVNIHLSANLLRDVACNHLPSAANTCRHFRFLQDPPKYNPSYSLPLDHAVVAARRLGLLAAQVPREAAFALAVDVQASLNHADADLPLRCVAREAQEALLRASLQAESDVFGPQALPVEARHRLDFHRQAATELCVCDGKALLEKDPRWRRFFASIRPSTEYAALSEEALEAITPAFSKQLQLFRQTCEFGSKNLWLIEKP